MHDCGLDHHLVSADALPAADAACALVLLAASSGAAPIIAVAAVAATHVLFAMEGLARLTADSAGDVMSRFAASGGPNVILACFRLLARSPNTPLALHLAKLFESGLQCSEAFFAQVLAANGIPALLDALSCTLHSDSVVCALIWAVSNACSREGASGLSVTRAFAEAGVFSFLQPALLSANAIGAAFCVATLARNENLLSFVDSAELIPVLLDVLRAMPFGAPGGDFELSAIDAPSISAMLSSPQPAFQLACLHMLAQECVGKAADRNLVFLRRTASVLGGVRLAAASHDAFVYSGACEFPASARLPENVRAVMSANAVKWIAEYRDASLKKLVENLVR